MRLCGVLVVIAVCLVGFCSVVDCGLAMFGVLICLAGWCLAALVGLSCWLLCCGCLLLVVLMLWLLVVVFIVIRLIVGFGLMCLYVCCFV